MYTLLYTNIPVFKRKHGDFSFALLLLGSVGLDSKKNDLSLCAMLSEGTIV